MNDLIERIEAASGPDRELDELIRCEVFAPWGAYVKQSPINGSWCIYHVGYDGKERLWGPRNITPEQRFGRFSSSIDAALTLVPEGFEWSLEYQAGYHVSSDVECMIAIAKLGDPCRDWESESYTPALALCGAALKARAYLKETNNGQ